MWKLLKWAAVALSSTAAGGILIALLSHKAPNDGSAVLDTQFCQNVAPHQAGSVPVADWRIYSSDGQTFESAVPLSQSIVIYPQRKDSKAIKRSDKFYDSWIAQLKEKEKLAPAGFFKIAPFSDAHSSQINAFKGYLTREVQRRFAADPKGSYTCFGRTFNFAEMDWDSPERQPKHLVNAVLAHYDAFVRRTIRLSANKGSATKTFDFGSSPAFSSQEGSNTYELLSDAILDDRCCSEITSRYVASTQFFLACDKSVTSCYVNPQNPDSRIREVLDHVRSIDFARLKLFAVHRWHLIKEDYPYLVQLANFGETKGALFRIERCTWDIEGIELIDWEGLRLSEVSFEIRQSTMHDLTHALLKTYRAASGEINVYFNNTIIPLELGEEALIENQ